MSAPESLDAVIAEYLMAVDGGKVQDREEPLARYPDLASELQVFFSDQDRLDILAAPLKPPPDPDATRPPAPEPSTISPGPSVDDIPGSPLGVVRYFGDYELLEEIARGGMGVVFKARQVSLNRVVALKMILIGQRASAADVQRFRQEAEAAANLDHPNILHIYEVGEHDGQHYFSMKLVEGGNLADIRSALVRDPKRAARLLAKVCRAAHFAHQRGILHRDLKPANVLLDRDDVPYVTDFGLAKRVEGDSGLTQSGVIVGTPSYMAPEQARAEKALTTAVDVYAIGAILYECLTGRPPFRAASPLDTVLHVLERDPDWPRALNPGADRDLETVAMRCLEKDPARRYDSAAAVADELERWLRGESILARPSSSWNRVKKWAKRHPAVAGLSTALAMALAGGAVTSSVMYLRAEAARAAADEQRQAVQDQLWHTTVERARAERLAGHRQGALDVLAEAVAMRPDPDLRTEAIQTLILPEARLVCQLGPRSLHIGGGDVHVLEFSGDSTLLAHVNNYRVSDSPTAESVTGIEVWAIPSGNLVGRTPAEYGGNGRTFAFSPTAPLLAVWAGGMVRLWEPATGRDLASFAGRPPLCFSPDGRSLAAIGADGVLLANTTTGKVTPLAVRGQPYAFLSATELLIENAGRLIRWDLATGREAFATPAGLQTASVSPDGRLAVLRAGNGAGTAWDLASGREVGPVPDLGKLSYRASAPLQGAAGLLAFADPADNLVMRLWDVRAGRPRPGVRSPRISGVALEYGSFRPDGTVIAAVEFDGRVHGPNNAINLWDVNSARLLATLPDFDRPVWSPEGRYLATIGEARFNTPGGGSTSGTANATRVYEVTTPVPAARGTAAVGSITFMADGRRLAANGSVWAVVPHPGRLALLPVAQPSAPAHRYAADHGHVWAIPDNAPFTPDQPLTIRELTPDPVEIELRRPDEPVTIQRPPNDPPLTIPARHVSCRVSAFAVNADGTRMLLGLDLSVPLPADPARTNPWGRLELWDLASKSRVAVLGSEGFGQWSGLRFSGDGRTVMAAGGRGANLWDAVGGKALPEMEVTEEVGPSHTYVRHAWRATFTPDGRRVFAALEGNRLGVFEVATGRVVRSWLGPAVEVTTLAVAPDGRTAATGDDNRAIRLWDLETGRQLARWEGHEAGVTALAFDPTGRALTSGDAAGTVKLWDLAWLRRELGKMGLEW